MPQAGPWAWEEDGDRADRTALEEVGGSVSYGRLAADSADLARRLLAGRRDLAEARVAFLVTPGSDWVRALWAVWRAGGIAVPLCLSHPAAELEYVLRDCEPELVLCQPDLVARVAGAAAQCGVAVRAPSDLEPEAKAGALPSLAPERRALIVYTSGTTGGPKGVVSSHANLAAQIASLRRAWEWSDDDRILLTLPLHHVHGIVNVLGCALASGATCVARSGFEASTVWQDFREQDLTLFMGVPTMYYRLARAWEESPEATRGELSRACRSFRLMVSGSAALPASVLERWRKISGHTLLERYGMTETGMILSNPLHGERVAGAVGLPLPGVEVRLRDEAGQIAAEEGEVEVRGPGVFREYWRRPLETAAAFTSDGWFRTGDIARFDSGTYRLLGRASVDIVKTGGYKVSALEVEEVLRRHPAVADCAVVGVADEEWGERLVAALEATDGEAATAPEDLRAWAKECLAPYKVPRELRWLEALPRNALGKVTKPAVRELFESAQRSAGAGTTG